MKRYIRSAVDVTIDTSMFAGTPFVCDTDTSYYNDFLNQKDLQYMQSAKNRTGEVVMMSPTEYFEECSQYGFPGGPVDVDHVIAGRRADTDSLNWLKNRLTQGEKFYLPYIDYAAHSQEGLHRMMVVGDKYGWDTKFPVLVVTAYDDEVEHQNQVFREYLSFRDHEFDKICEDAAAEYLYDWTGYPDNSITEESMLSGLSAAIVDYAKTYGDGYDIDVTVDAEETEDGHLLNIYITRFDDYDTSDRYEGHSMIFEEYMSSPHSYNTAPDNLDDIDSLLDHMDLDDMDLSDAALEKLFFRDN